MTCSRTPIGNLGLRGLSSVGMCEKLGSSETLLEGMAQVGYGDASQLTLRESRKRELQQLIQVNRWAH